MRNGRTVARAQGAYYGITGLWPLLHMRSFELLLGRKKEHWLVHTVSALLIANAFSLVRTGTAPAEIAAARRTGLGVAAALGLIDLRYGAPGRISRMYLADALIEAGWIVAWARIPTNQRPV
jgi:hypothetical protein